MVRYVALALLAAAAAVAAPPDPRPTAPFPPPKSLGPVETYGANVQRAMTLMATSTPMKRNTVRVLFYGQSITTQAWTKVVADRLRRQYPLADLVIENRAIGGYTSNLLVKTAEADLYPFYPDLVIFHVYGPVDKYEDILRRLRERTAADILHATDHLSVTLGDRVDEETDPGKLTAVNGMPWVNNVALPGLSRKYATELADVRGVWKRYLTDYKLGVPDLLADAIHLNARGNFVMAKAVSAHLRHRPELPDAAWKDRVTTYTVGTDVRWKDGKLTLPFDGNRVDLVCREVGDGPPVAVRIDGRKPSAFPELYTPTRAEESHPRWAFVPIVLRVRANVPLVVEDWVLTVTETAADRSGYRFRVAGSVTGDDGDGETGKRFVSRSGRVVIDPDDHNLVMLRAAPKPPPAGYAVRWRVAPLFADEFAVPARRNPFGDTVVTVAQGLANGPHTLELTGGPDTPLAAVRVHRPPLRAKAE